METKTATKAKIKGFVLLFLLPLIVCYAQSKNIIHLSYNIKEPYKSVRKIENLNGDIEFYIDNQCFQFQVGKNEIFKIEPGSLKNIDIIDIGSLLRLSQQMKRELLEKEERTGIITVLTNDKIFEKIYLYVKTELGTIERFEVRWIEKTE